MASSSSSPSLGSSSFDAAVASSLHSFLLDPTIRLPIRSFSLLTQLIQRGDGARLSLTDLPRFDACLEALADSWEDGHIRLSADAGGLSLVAAHVSATQSRKRKRDTDAPRDVGTTVLSAPHVAGSRELQHVYALLQRGSAKRRLLAEQFASPDPAFEPICAHTTKADCIAFQHARNPGAPPPRFCERVHFRPLIRGHTDPSLGHCSYLNTCYSEPTYALSPSLPPAPRAVALPSGLGAGGRGKDKAPCRYLHFEVDYDPADDPHRRPERPPPKTERLAIGMGPTGKIGEPLPPQWVNCDLRRFDYSVLGKFHVIMADPPWDIHMSLPYGTMTDDEMRAMPMAALQDEGLLFLWVTGRAMEVGRECLRVWGYTRVDEVVWVKTNQLQRVIRTGRTGHWLNHTKEHMLVAVKTHTDPVTGALRWPSWANRGLDADVLVSEVRETSRKPDEVYGLIERMCPGGRKIEIFGRKHNTRPGWLTLGNQLGGDQIFEEDLAQRIAARYPERAGNNNAQ